MLSSNASDERNDARTMAHVRFAVLVQMEWLSEHLLHVERRRRKNMIDNERERERAIAEMKKMVVSEHA